MMNIIINKGTTDVIIDISDLLELLQYSVVALDRVYSEHIDVTNSISYMKNNIAHLEEYISSLRDDEED
jgi:hypothetical protein